jgi:c-di-AMP phosphodiesterase-like protein
MNYFVSYVVYLAFMIYFCNKHLRFKFELSVLKAIIASVVLIGLEFFFIKVLSGIYAWVVTSLIILIVCMFCQRQLAVKYNLNIAHMIKLKLSKVDADK